ncbi:putative radial spoke head protein 3 [Monocercomonoides exilis]|uniref:putative radial spoke head protein 3 n=1 Tax=Monocercomonoides exilis TaxID=2049356 RepID=UPI00355ACB33|nr:putative radial spoke head protein 3 [Monocercomonoides exilis]|eukprot:MONOS_5119.1-p1 / transcript=MONOS_5119.1 / gene=MONOS_5119 / organism=Monocercomonoides_exilis_PA203 / gene_product=radial spoke head protein 3 homolog / transcript_product=radial spoke head protein 3 homolog / location=Mono_scaffold00145:81744-83342(-) / protein_length=430 / sequence_SO=supercontig / SO=protein_coding / is_pseudo=false
MLNTQYSYSSAPQAVQTQVKYRTPGQNEGQRGYGNMMFDRRIKRGNTYAPHIGPINAEEEAQRLKKATMKRTRRIQKREEDIFQQIDSEAAVIPGRVHIDVQTEQYLEELSDKVPEFDVQTQTDYFLDQSTVPVFNPIKTGVDAGTQIDDDFFDFDFECEPLLEVLIGKTLEQSLLEVMEEEEIRGMRMAREEMRERREEEERIVREEEEREARRWEEKERRLAQERERKEKERVVGSKVMAVAFAHDLLKSLPSAVNGSLQSAGFFADARMQQLTSTFIPWLLGETERKRQQRQTARRLVSSILEASLRRGAERHTALCYAIAEGRSIGSEEEQTAEEQQKKVVEQAMMEKEEERERLVMKREEREKRIAEELEQKEREKQERILERTRREEERLRQLEEEEEQEGEGEGEEEDEGREEEEENDDEEDN